MQSGSSGSSGQLGLVVRSRCQGQAARANHTGIRRIGSRNRRCGRIDARQRIGNASRWRIVLDGVDVGDEQVRGAGQTSAVHHQGEERWDATKGDIPTVGGTAVRRGEAVAAAGHGRSARRHDVAQGVQGSLQTRSGYIPGNGARGLTVIADGEGTTRGTRVS